MRINRLNTNQVSFSCNDISKADIELIVYGVSTSKKAKKVIEEFIDLIRRTPFKDIRIG